MNLDMLQTQYAECNEHLRESDKKRDVAFGIYVTLSVAMYRFDGLLGSSDLLILAILILISLGIVLGVVFTLYRGWHGFYVIQGIALQKASHAKDFMAFDGNFIKGIKFQFNLLTSVELMMFVVLETTVLIHIWAAYSLSADNVWWKVITFFALGVVVCEFVGHFVVMFYFDQLKKTGRLDDTYLWMLQGLWRQSEHENG